MTVAPSERRETLDELTRLAARDLRGVWSRATALDTASFAPFIIDAFPEVTLPYTEIAAQLAATWFELSAPESPYIAITASPVPVEKLVKSAEWALDATGTDALPRLEGTLDRAVYDGARETTRVNVERTNSRWAVHARPQACPWCRMMATRGAVYKARATALSSCHDNGHCVAIEIRRRGQYTPPAYMEKWEDEYVKARANAGSGDPKAIQSAWRQVIAADA